MFTIWERETNSQIAKNSGIDKIEMAVLKRCACPLVIVGVFQPPDWLV
jgi:hypothetical protein